MSTYVTAKISRLEAHIHYQWQKTNKNTVQWGSHCHTCQVMPWFPQQLPHWLFSHCPFVYYNPTYQCQTQLTQMLWFSSILSAPPSKIHCLLQPFRQFLKKKKKNISWQKVSAQLCQSWCVWQSLALRWTLRMSARGTENTRGLISSVHFQKNVVCDFNRIKGLSP